MSKVDYNLETKGMVCVGVIQHLKSVKSPILDVSKFVR